MEDLFYTVRACYSWIIGNAPVPDLTIIIVLASIVLAVAEATFLKKRDDVSAVMSIAAVLAGVGEPWVRVLVIVSYTTLAIYQYSKSLYEGKEVGEVETREMRLPIPLLLAALAIGLRVATKWADYRHLTWMIA
uniref:Uncharacterized protein n=1 Tax=Cajanus cajan TaxID=3821 RepID=A0A151S8A0_CAJCA|nr:hypothetical protein KK1_027096 [Cajanus cajan]